MFFRNATDSASGRRPASRSASSTEAQLKELRNKARRRLIGALALVLAAVIIVPPLFDHTPPAEQHEPIVVPAAPSIAPSAEPASQAAGSVSADETTTMAGASPAASDTDESAQDDPLTVPSTVPPTEQAGAGAAPAAATADSANAPKVAEKPKPAPHEPARPKRTDDGSVALALLAGKIPDTPVQKPNKPAASAAQGNFVLQVAAYTTEQDANQRRDKLVESGVTNSYVERAQSGDKTVYRLRVGPFTSHEAAQASQTRLRALGYQNGMISSK